MASNPDYYVTPEEYLAIERKADSKSEYVDGVVYAMAGATERHNTLVANLIMSIGIQLRGRPCKVCPTLSSIQCEITLKEIYDKTL
jgi:Uma2 family endonuclease